MSRAFAAFAHSGDPNYEGLPRWKPYTAAERRMMIFNYVCKIADDPGRADRLALEALNLRPFTERTSM